MIDPQSYRQLQGAIAGRIENDRFLLDQLRTEIRPLQAQVRRIQPRNTTAISVVGTDGGSNRIAFDPFLMQIIRVVDSSNNEYCLDVITPTTNVTEKSAEQFHPNGRPRTPLGEMMVMLGVRHLAELSRMIRHNDGGRPVSPHWVDVYRELTEWAVLYSIVRQSNFGTDTLVVFDGLLRSLVFAGDLFQRYLQELAAALAAHWQQKRHVYLVGVAKHSKVLTRYRLAMALEGVLATHYPAYVEIPRHIEERAYVHAEFARGDDVVLETERLNKFVGGKMFFVKFGNRPQNPIWPVDIYLPQAKLAPTVLGHLLADAQNGFPVPFYPLCLQRAHKNAALVDFDFDLLQDQIIDGIRRVLGQEAIDLDIFRLQEADPAQVRYEYE
ncbi:MAG: hypothetical protein L0332_13670 [Chloroflexi bacterium]|nr:hypothetical protein [Chloroflexota bacterium]MCI0645571.1 hypothetical protein [Chloroflexota bacterium]MCI0727752.1 hypothetical protein [Chloroflexota bacterium]